MRPVAETGDIEPVTIGNSPNTYQENCTRLTTWGVAVSGSIGLSVGLLPAETAGTHVPCSASKSLYAAPESAFPVKTIHDHQRLPIRFAR